MKLEGLEARRRWNGLSPTLKGVMWMLFACVAFSGMGLSVRYLSRFLPSQELIFFRNALSLIWMFPWIVRNGFTVLRTAHFRMYLGRSALAFASMLCWFTALATLPLAEAVALGFTAPLFSTVLAVLILGEVVRMRRWTATIIGFLGAMVILRPGIEEVTFAHLLVLAASATGAITSVVVKQLTRTEHPNTIVTYMTLLTTPFALRRRGVETRSFFPDRVAPAHEEHAHRFVAVRHHTVRVDQHQVGPRPFQCKADPRVLPCNCALGFDPCLELPAGDQQGSCCRVRCNVTEHTAIHRLALRNPLRRVGDRHRRCSDQLGLTLPSQGHPAPHPRLHQSPRQ